MTTVEFNVLGVPAPQGSKTKMPNGAMVEAGSATGRHKVRAWRGAVAEAALVERQKLPAALDGPLMLTVVFRFATPPSRRKADRARWTQHTTKPDLSKLVRATEDALTDSGLIVDDARIFSLWTRKCEVPDGEWTGAEITVSDIGDDMTRPRRWRAA